MKRRDLGKHSLNTESYAKQLGRRWYLKLDSSTSYKWKQIFKKPKAQ